MSGKVEGNAMKGFDIEFVLGLLQQFFSLLNLIISVFGNFFNVFGDAA